MQRSRVVSRIISSIFLACSLFALQICVGMQAIPALAASTTLVRVVHAAPGIGTADVFADGARLLSNFQFGTITGYLPVPLGAHKIQIAAIGTGITAAVITQTLEVGAGGPYTIAAIGDQTSGFSLVVFADNNTLTTGTAAKLRVYHLSPGSGTVNVVEGTKTVIQGLAYQHASDYIYMSAGAHTLNVSFTTASNALPVSTTLQPETVTSIFTVGVSNGNPKLQLVTEQAPGMPAMPGTGSDPRPSTDMQLPMAMLSGILALLALAGAIVLYLWPGARSRSRE